MLRDELVTVPDSQPLALALDIHRLPNQAKRHRVAVRLKAHEPILGNDAGHAASERKAGLPANNEEVLALALEALDGPLMRGAVHALIGDVEVPLIELLLEIHHVHEAAAGREVP